MYLKYIICNIYIYIHLSKYQITKILIILYSWISTGLPVFLPTSPNLICNPCINLDGSFVHILLVSIELYKIILSEYFVYPGDTAEIYTQDTLSSFVL